MSLQQTLNRIKEIQPFATEDVNSGPLETLNARRGRARAATEELKQLRETFAMELMSSAAFILVTGANRDQFTETASTEFGCFGADPESFYKDLAGRVHSSLYEGKEGVRNLFDVVSRHLEDLALEIGVVGYPQLQFRQEYARQINSKEEFTSLLKVAVNDQVGGEVVGVHAVRSILDRAIATGHSARITPVLLNTADEALILTLIPALKRLTPNVFLVVAGKADKSLRSVEGVVAVKNTDKDTVETVLKNIRENARK